ncbi:erythromycin esterase [Paenibacillus mucilaginosus]|uniref:erythromycin esterase family protein n=1 Tax=Paenibacillus mucilaginosus TaxID=61624 RepID=UPI003D1AAF78
MNLSELNGESPEFTWIEQHAAVIEQFTKMMGYLPEKPKDFYNQYDIAMYENARWTEEKLGKSIVWAHNGHTAKTLPQVYDEIAGQHLAKHYGPKYVSIGTSVTTGQYQAEEIIVPFPVNANHPESFNYAFGQVEFPQYAIDLHKSSRAAKSWLNEQRR